jgi:S1-C subfamily serine protease
VLVADRAWSVAGVLGLGLEPGDVIHEAGGVPVRNVDELKRVVDSVSPGRAIGLQVERAGVLLYVAVEHL